MLNLMPVEMFGVYPNVGTYGARIRRFDGLVYDPSDNSFKTESTITTPFISLVQGTNNDQTLRSATVDVFTWEDGDYFVYFHDLGSPINMVTSEVQVQIWNGSWMSIRTPTATEIAQRFSVIDPANHTAENTFGGDWNLLKRQIDYIGNYIQNVSGITFPKV